MINLAFIINKSANLVDKYYNLKFSDLNVYKCQF